MGEIHEAYVYAFFFNIVLTFIGQGGYLNLGYGLFKSGVLFEEQR
jgi:hypothetical protein